MKKANIKISEERKLWYIKKARQHDEECVRDAGEFSEKFPAPHDKSNMLPVNPNWDEAAVGATV